MNSEERKQFRPYDTEAGLWLSIAGALTILLAVISAILSGIFYRCEFREGLMSLALAWSVLPPMWFWIEYHCIYREYGNAEAFDAFKHGQDISRAVWLGLTAAMFAMVATL